MIKAIAIDDEPLALELIEDYCRPFDFIQFEKKFTKTAAALQYLAKNPVDLLFLDINMPALSGVELYRSLEHKPMLIFTTSYSEYAIESYELDAIDYLLKPFTLERFQKAVTKAYDQYKLIHQATAPEKNRYITLKADHGIVNILPDNILFIEGLDNYLKIHLESQSPLVIRLTMKALLEKLPEKDFLRVHRSYIVPLHRIESIKQRIITIGAEEIPVGKNYEDELKARFSALQ